MPSVVVIWLREEGCRLLDGAPGSRQATLVDGQLVAAGVDRLLETLDRQVGELLRDRLEASSQIVELTGHGSSLPGGTDTEGPRRF